MNLYDSIRSPFEDNDVLYRIIGLYSSMEREDDNLYSKIIAENSEKSIFNKKKYLEDFEKLILKPTIEKLYSNLKYKVKNEKRLWGIDAKEWQTVLYKCNTYADVETTINYMYKNYRDKQIMQNIFNSVVSLNEDEARNEFKTKTKEALNNYSEKDLKQLTNFVIIQKRILQMVTQKSKNVMGFHVNAEKVLDPKHKNEKNEIKFYINAGDDTCKIAALFREKCIEQNLNYYFKIADPFQNEEWRNDKLCIYSSLDDAQKFLTILQQIKKENPQMFFKEPPILAGRVDEWIGIASDYRGNKKKSIPRDSYNSQMSCIVVKAIEKVFNGVDRKDITGKIEEDSNLIGELRNEIITIAGQLGYSEEKICVRNSDKKKLSKGPKSNLFDKIKGLFLKKKQLPSAKLEKSYLRNKRNKFIERTKEGVNSKDINMCGNNLKNKVKSIKNFLYKEDK